MPVVATTPMTKVKRSKIEGKAMYANRPALPCVCDTPGRDATLGRARTHTVGLAAEPI